MATRKCAWLCGGGGGGSGEVVVVMATAALLLWVIMWRTLSVQCSPPRTTPLYYDDRDSWEEDDDMMRRTNPESPFRPQFQFGQARGGGGSGGRNPSPPPPPPREHNSYSEVSYNSPYSQDWQRPPPQAPDPPPLGRSKSSRRDSMRHGGGGGGAQNQQPRSPGPRLTTRTSSMRRGADRNSEPPESTQSTIRAPPECKDFRLELNTPKFTIDGREYFCWITCILVIESSRDHEQRDTVFLVKSRRHVAEYIFMKFHNNPDVSHTPDYDSGWVSFYDWEVPRRTNRRKDVLGLWTACYVSYQPVGNTEIAYINLYRSRCKRLDFNRSTTPTITLPGGGDSYYQWGMCTSIDRYSRIPYYLAYNYEEKMAEYIYMKFASNGPQQPDYGGRSVKIQFWILPMTTPSYEDRDTGQQELKNYVIYSRGFPSSYALNYDRVVSIQEYDVPEEADPPSYRQQLPVLKATQLEKWEQNRTPTFHFLAHDIPNGYIVKNHPLKRVVASGDNVYLVGQFALWWQDPERYLRLEAEWGRTRHGMMGITWSIDRARERASAPSGRNQQRQTRFSAMPDQTGARPMHRKTSDLDLGGRTRGAYKRSKAGDGLDVLDEEEEEEYSDEDDDEVAQRPKAEEHREKARRHDRDVGKAFVQQKADEEFLKQQQEQRQGGGGGEEDRAGLYRERRERDERERCHRDAKARDEKERREHQRRGEAGGRGGASRPSATTTGGSSEAARNKWKAAADAARPSQETPRERMAALRIRLMQLNVAGKERSREFDEVTRELAQLEAAEARGEGGGGAGNAPPKSGGGGKERGSERRTQSDDPAKGRVPPSMPRRATHSEPRNGPPTATVAKDRSSTLRRAETAPTGGGGGSGEKWEDSQKYKKIQAEMDKVKGKYAKGTDDYDAEMHKLREEEREERKKFEKKRDAEHYRRTGKEKTGQRDKKNREEQDLQQWAAEEVRLWARGKSYYSILEIPSNASRGQVLKAFVTTQKRFCPNLEEKKEKSAQELALLVEKAKMVTDMVILKVEDQRREYDARLWAEREARKWAWGKSFYEMIGLGLDGGDADARAIQRAYLTKQLEFNPANGHNRHLDDKEKALLAHKKSSIRELYETLRDRRGFNAQAAAVGKARKWALQGQESLSFYALLLGDKYSAERSESEVTEEKLLAAYKARKRELDPEELANAQRSPETRALLAVKWKMVDAAFATLNDAETRKEYDDGKWKPEV